MDEGRDIEAHVTPSQLVQQAAGGALPWLDDPDAELPVTHDQAQLLRIVARMHRYDGASKHLEADAFALLVRLLAAGDAAWIDQAALLWRQLVLHVGEAAMAWPQAGALLDRFPDAFDEAVGALGALATVASCAGAPEAVALWERVVTHPRFADDAGLRRDLEREWARTHLMLAGGQPARALTILRRLRHEQLDHAGPDAQLRLVDATLDLVCGLAWIGDPHAALELVDETLRRLTPGGELDAWMQGVGAYAAAIAGDHETAAAGLRAADRAATDTAILQLRALLPARIVLGTVTGDLDEVRAAVADAATLDRSRRFDADAYVTWRVHACEAFAALGRTDLLAAALQELDAALDVAGLPLVAHELRRDRVAALLDGEDAVADDATFHRRAAALGCTLPDLARVPDPTPGPLDRLELDVLGPIRVRRNGEPVPAAHWSGRRQARVLLVLLLAQGGRASVETIGRTIWGDADDRAVRTRLSPLCNAIRTALGAAGDAAPDGTRRLRTHGGLVELELAPGDRCDLFELRRAVDCVRREPARSRELARDAIRLVDTAPAADLGTDEPALQLRDMLEHEQHAALVVLAGAWSGHPAPDELLAAAVGWFDAEPTSVDAAELVMRLHADRDDLPAASRAFHTARAALREHLGLDAPRRLVRLHDDLVGAQPLEA